MTETEAGGSSIAEHRGAMGEHVLAVLKQKIKTNYDQLYSNYPENRNKIFKQIQTVETNINGENAMNTKYQEIFKEKGKYDKIKATVEDKQRKLKKVTNFICSFLTSGISFNKTVKLNRWSKQNSSDKRLKK